MTSKERMMRAVRREKPDRLPVTIHQWQKYHLDRYMGGMDQIQAYAATGLDAAVTPWTVRVVPSADWDVKVDTHFEANGDRVDRIMVRTPSGSVSWRVCTNEYTGYLTEHPIKTEKDAGIFLKHYPRRRLDHAALNEIYDRTGDAGIVRGSTIQFYAQPGLWQDFAELVGTEKAILWAMDAPQFVHHFLQGWTNRALACIREDLPGAKFDLIEHGGGAASSNVISPAMFDEFCLPYDKQIIDALHEVGFPVVYHTCGWMMSILENIPRNGCDASETLSPPASGGDITVDRRRTVKAKLGSKVGLIGGFDQCRILTEGTAGEVGREVRALFEAFGRDGGYICSASDHFFHSPVENLKAMARAAAECRY